MQPTNQRAIFDKMVQIICEKFGAAAQDVTMDRNFDDPELGIDSLDKMGLFIDFENEFGILIEDKRVEKARTLGDAVKLVESLGGRVQQNTGSKKSLNTNQSQKAPNNLPDPTVSQLVQMPFGDVLRLLVLHSRNR